MPTTRTQNNQQVVQVVQPIKAPILASFSRLAIAEFQMAYDRYVISSRANGINARTELECLDPKLLVVLAKQYLQQEPSEIVNDDLTNFLTSRLRADTHYTEEKIKKLLAGVKMDLSEKDPIQRVTAYNMSYLTTMTAHGLDRLMDHEGFRKQMVSLLLDGVRPTSLRQLMRQKTKTSEARSDPRTFFELLEEWAPLQDVFHAETVKTAKYVEERTTKKDSGKRKRHPDTPQKPKKESEKRQRQLPCLICGKTNHRTKDHRGASKEDLDKAFSEYREKKAKVCTESVLRRLKSNESKIESRDSDAPRIDKSPLDDKEKECSTLWCIRAVER